MKDSKDRGCSVHGDGGFKSLNVGAKRGERSKLVQKEGRFEQTQVMSLQVYLQKMAISRAHKKPSIPKYNPWNPFISARSTMFFSSVAWKGNAIGSKAACTSTTHIWNGSAIEGYGFVVAKAVRVALSIVA